jgi:hypothetical protein
MTDLLQAVILVHADGARRRLAFEVVHKSAGPLCTRNHMRERLMLVHIFRGAGTDEDEHYVYAVAL